MAQADILTFHMFDNEGLPCGVKIFVESGHTAADMTAYAQAMVAKIDAASDAYIDNVTWLSTIALPGAGEKGAATATGNSREVGASLLWGMTGRDSESIHLPAVLRASVEGDNIVFAGVIEDLKDQLELTVNTVDATDGNEEVLSNYKRVTKSIRRKR
jgi:hypothetical protein